VAGDGRLTGQELVLLQLRASGYSLTQAAELAQCSPEAARAALFDAAAALGASDEQDAIAIARRRGLVT
jgi:DNA-binding CsgD family transcriptional regulator